MTIFKDNLISVVEAVIWEDSTPFLMARVLKLNAATPAVQSDFTSIRYTVSERKTGKFITGATLTISSVIFNTLQTDAKWTRDSIGYNFGFTISSASFPESQTEYVVTVFFTPITGSVFSTQYRIYPEKVYYGVPTNILLIRGDTYKEIIKGLPSLSSISKIWFVVKENRYDIDSEAIIKIDNTIGLEVLEGFSTGLTVGDGIIIIDSASSGDITITLKHASSLSLIPRKLVYFAIKALFSDATTKTITEGLGEIKLGMIQDAA